MSSKYIPMFMIPAEGFDVDAFLDGIGGDDGLDAFDGIEIEMTEDDVAEMVADGEADEDDELGQLGFPEAMIFMQEGCRVARRADITADGDTVDWFAMDERGRIIDSTECVLAEIPDDIYTYDDWVVIAEVH